MLHRILESSSDESEVTNSETPVNKVLLIKLQAIGSPPSPSFSSSLSSSLDPGGEGDDGGAPVTHQAPSFAMSDSEPAKAQTPAPVTLTIPVVVL